MRSHLAESYEPMFAGHVGRLVGGGHKAMCGGDVDDSPPAFRGEWREDDGMEGEKRTKGEC